MFLVIGPFQRVIVIDLYAACPIFIIYTLDLFTSFPVDKKHMLFAITVCNGIGVLIKQAIFLFASYFLR